MHMDVASLCTVSLLYHVTGCGCDIKTCQANGVMPESAWKPQRFIADLPKCTVEHTIINGVHPEMSNNANRSS